MSLMLTILAIEKQNTYTQYNPKSNECSIWRKGLKNDIPSDKVVRASISTAVLLVEGISSDMQYDIAAIAKAAAMAATDPRHLSLPNNAL